MLMDELRQLGADAVRERPAGVEFQGNLETAYRACLWLRTANRVLMPLATFKADSPEALYAGIQQIDWSQHLLQDGSLAVDCVTKNSKINHSQFASQKVKDAIVDQFRAQFGERPSVDIQRPDIRVNIHISRDEVILSLDLSGNSLHKRGYRQHGGVAPLKENLAAAILLRADWQSIAEQGGTLVDPMCGSGTLSIEAAMIAADIAPGLERDYFGFLNWQQHDAPLWQKLINEAQQRKVQGLKRLPPIFAYDEHPKAIQIAQGNIVAAGLDKYIRIMQCGLSELKQPDNTKPGLVIINPPYGERLGEKETLGPLYQQLGSKLKIEFVSWQAAVFTGNSDLAKQMGLRAHKLHNMYNGALECQLLRFNVEEKWFIDTSGKPRAAKSEDLGPGAEMLANRLRKNLRELKKWAKREQVDCYRLYDADMPEYALAIDLYHGDQRWVVVQEYEAPKTIDPQKARQRLREAMAVIPEVLEVPEQQVFFKVRRRQKGAAQYEKQEELSHFHKIKENGLRFLVNFEDYLDTGLFLDHRLTRTIVGELAKGKRFLNLFAYTGSATVYAAQGGAVSTTTVDMSKTYIDWAERNMALNGFEDKSHKFVQADCLQWLDEQIKNPWGKQKYDLIFLDPPTFSSSKRMHDTFDVQRDHIELIKKATALLEPGGELIFSNNFKKFVLDEASLVGLEIKNITAVTLPKDFARNPKIHQCWKIKSA